ncbi:MAG: hypothetical protein R3Y43_06225 [Alphaproteobacteria bacterium]
MNNIKRFLLGLVCITFVCTFSKPGYSFLFPVGPCIDPLNITGEAAGNVQTAANKVMNVKSTINDAINDAKKALAELIAGVLGGKRKPGKVPGAKKIATSEFVDYSDKAAVQKKIYELFWTYPEPDDKNNDYATREEVNGYRAKATEFYQDNLIEVWAAARGLEAELENIRADTLTLKEEVVSDEEGGSQLGLNELWKKVYEAYKTYDALYALIEEMTAMKAQLIMSKGIKYDVKPVYPTTSTTSSLLIYNADNMYASEDLFKDAPDVEMTNMPFFYAKEEAAELSKFEEPYYYLVSALDYHNTMYYLPQYRDLFNRYEQTLRLHEKAKEMVSVSDNCAIKFLGRYYSNAAQLWAGTSVNDKVSEIERTTEVNDWIDDSVFFNTEYLNRGGLSGWAYQLFIVAKAIRGLEDEGNYAVDGDGNIDGMSTASADGANFVEEEPIVYDDEGVIITDAPENYFDKSAMDSSKDSKDKEVDSDSNSGFADEDSKKKAEEDIRKTQLIPWDIGSEVIQDLVNNEAEWNADVKSNFPVWNDQKLFYGQYLDKKYDNILEYFDSNVPSQVKANIADVLSSQDTTEILSKYALTAFESSVDSKIEKIKEIIKSTQEEVKTLPLESFRSTNSQEFVTIHKKMFDKINELGIDSDSIISLISATATADYNTAAAAAAATGGVSTVALIATSTITKLIEDVFADLTEDLNGDGTFNLLKNIKIGEDYYATADTDYFVGSTDAKRDLKAPCKIPATSSLDPREIFYFDEVDWENSGGESLTNTGFLNSGTIIPEIWKYMLKDKAFVETDFDLDTALSLTGSAASINRFIKLGKYPCILSQDGGDYIIDIQYNTNTSFNYKFSYKDNSNNFDYQECKLEESLDDIIYGREMNVITGKDVETAKYGTIKAYYNDYDDNASTSSELGMLFSKKNTFREFAKGIFNEAVNNQSSSSSSDTKKETFNDYIRGNVAFKVNQIGDFLRTAEEEAEIRKTLDELKAQIEIVKWGEKNEDGSKKSDGLYDKLNSLGFEVSDSFTLSNETDYNSALEKLEDAKFAKVLAAQLVLDVIDTNNNTVAESKKEDYNNTIRALEQDSSALVALTEDPPSKTDLALQIIEETVNRIAVLEQQAVADEEMENSINNFQKPYCAAY